MAFTNTKESGLEALIVKWLVEQNDYEQGTNADYNRDYAIDETRLFRFLQDTQPDALDKLGVFKTDMKKKQFLNRLQGEIAKRGVIDVLRNGVKVYPANLIMFYLTPTENNAKAKEMYEKNIFSVTRQLMYSNDSTRLALDMCVFINGLPVITFELKNQLTKQNVDDAVQQYKDDRDPRELLFQFKRCMVHFAVDDARVKFCTKLDGKNSWFLPFDKGYNDGAGNPPNPDGLMTDYLWKKILTKDKLSRIIENYAQVVVEEDPETKKKSVKQIFPRYHQLDCVEKLLADVKTNGVGKRYLIQHSAGSGKSNSIAWLAHQLIGLEKNGHPMIDSVLVVTDRRILDKQIRDNIKQFMQVANTVAWAEHSGDLRKAIQAGKRIIITTVEKFPYVVPDIGAAHKTNHFAVIIDEAHSGQNGRNSAQMNLALSGLASEDEIREKFNSSPTLPDDDINTSVDQTKRLIIAIKNGLEYPSSKNGFKYDDIIDFFNKLSKIFDWPIYEKSTLGNESKRKWYAVILSQWMEGSGLSYIMQRAIDYHKQHPENFWVSAYQPPTIYNDNSKEHRNVVFADTLEAIENIVLFSISNYFLRFSNEYKKIHDVDEFDNNWYEYVEFGTTNPLTILLQRNGFSRESATFIKKHKDEYVAHDGSTDELRLRLSLLDCGNTSVMTEAASIRFNAPKLFLEEG